MKNVYFSEIQIKQKCSMSELLKKDAVKFYVCVSLWSQDLFIANVLALLHLLSLAQILLIF